MVERMRCMLDDRIGVAGMEGFYYYFARDGPFGAWGNVEKGRIINRRREYYRRFNIIYDHLL